MLVKERVVIAPDEGDVILSGVGFVGKLYGEENGRAFAMKTSPVTGQRPRGARTGRINALRTKSGQQSRNTGPQLNPAEIEKS